MPNGNSPMMNLLSLDYDKFCELTSKRLIIHNSFSYFTFAYDFIKVNRVLLLVNCNIAVSGYASSDNPIIYNKYKNAPIKFFKGDKQFGNRGFVKNDKPSDLYKLKLASNADTFKLAELSDWNLS